MEERYKENLWLIFFLIQQFDKKNKTIKWMKEEKANIRLLEDQTNC